MKKTMMLLLFVLVVVTATGQNTLSGQVKNSRGVGVEYVSIGIEGDSIGTISDINGFYSLTIPKGKKGFLKFSHVSYLPYSIPVQNINSKKMDVVLNENVKSLADVTVTYGKKTKKISSKGIKGPGTVKFSGTGCRFETGPVVKTATDYAITRILLPIENTTYSECTLSLNVYEIINGKFISILSKPIYTVL